MRTNTARYFPLCGYSFAKLYYRVFLYANATIVMICLKEGAISFTAIPSVEAVRMRGEAIVPGEEFDDNERFNTQTG